MTNKAGAQLEHITPQRAHHYLGFNTHNRNPRKRKIEAFARDMSAGRWMWNGAPIVFADDGTLLDGQNRLMAVIESGTAHDFLVVRGVDRQAQETMDTGTARKFSDALQLRGEPNAHQLAAAVRLVYLWQKGVRRFDGGQTIATLPELSRTLEDYPDVRDAIAPADRMRRAIRIPASAGALCCWLFQRIDLEDAEHFYGRVCSAEGHFSGEPIYALRASILRATASTGTSHRSHLNPTLVVALTIKAWNKYRLGERVELLRFRPGGANPEKFPEPV